MGVLGRKLLNAAAASAFPVIADTATTSGITGTPASINLPASISAGDMLFLVVQWKTNTSTFSSFSETWVQEMDSNVSGRRLMMFSRVADGTEGVTTSMTFSAGPSFCGAICWRVTGCSSVEVGTAATGTSTSPNPPSLAPSWGSAKTLWASYIGAADNRQSLSAYPANYTLSQTTTPGRVASDSTGQELWLAGYELETSSEDPAAGTLSGSIAWIAQTIAFQPS